MMGSRVGPETLIGALAPRSQHAALRSTSVALSGRPCMKTIQRFLVATSNHAVGFYRCDQTIDQKRDAADLPPRPNGRRKGNRKPGEKEETPVVEKLGGPSSSTTIPIAHALQVTF